MEEKKMKNQEKEKNKKKEMLKAGIIYALIILISLAVFMPRIKFALRRTEIKYCHFENNITGEFPRYECMNMKLVSKDMYLINLSQFDRLNLTYSCHDNIEYVPDCYAENMYFSTYSLALFSKTEGADGIICVEYYIDYYSNDTLKINQYAKYYTQKKFNNSEDLRNEFINCEEK